MSKKDQLLRWMKQKQTFATHEVIEWGTQNYCNRADRYKRDFQEAGLIRKMGYLKKEVSGYLGKEDVYVADDEKIKDYFQPSLFNNNP